MIGKTRPPASGTAPCRARRTWSGRGTPRTPEATPPPELRNSESRLVRTARQAAARVDSDDAAADEAAALAARSARSASIAACISIAARSSADIGCDCASLARCISSMASSSACALCAAFKSTLTPRTPRKRRRVVQFDVDLQASQCIAAQRHETLPRIYANGRGIYGCASPNLVMMRMRRCEFVRMCTARADIRPA